METLAIRIARNPTVSAIEGTYQSIKSAALGA
jgi:hypothetical protein